MGEAPIITTDNPPIGNTGDAPVDTGEAPVVKNICYRMGKGHPDT